MPVLAAYVAVPVTSAIAPVIASEILGISVAPRQHGQLAEREQIACQKGKTQESRRLRWLTGATGTRLM